MLFQSVEFIFVFLPIVFCGYHLLRIGVNLTAAQVFLVVCSAVFYAAHEPVFLFLLFGSVFCNYLFGGYIAERKSITALALGITFNIALLAYFKYAGFIVWLFNESVSSNLTIPQVALPLAISFFTFQQIAYLVDVYRYGCPSGGWLRFTLFVVFFPQLIAGPIVHHAEMILQFERARRFARLRLDVAIGLTIFTIGLAKKIILADSCGVFADIIFGRAAGGASPAFIESWIGAIAFGLQIYFDFSGYSDMAVGLARLFGIRLPVNFFSPYRSGSIIEFWRRWHITLSRFLRDYLYFTLGGNRKGPLRRYVNVLIVMVLGGLWHGAELNFVFWGALHGAYLIVNHAWRIVFPAPPGRLRRAFSWMVTLAAVMVAWVPFRAHDLDSIMNMWSGMAGLNGIALPRTVILAMGSVGQHLLDLGLRVDSDAFRALFWSGGTVNALNFAAAALIALLLPNTYQWMRRVKTALDARTFADSTSLPCVLLWRPSLLWAGFTAVLFSVAVYYQATPNAFLYFQF